MRKQTVKTSRVAAQLEKMFRLLNEHFYNGQLPEVVISLKKTVGAYGHFTCGKVWQAGNERRYEINISSATLNRPIEQTCSTLLHEMAHLACAVGYGNTEKDENGNVTVIHGTYDPATKSGSGFEGRKVKGTIHWVACQTAVKATVRLYENIIDEEKGVYNGLKSPCKRPFNVFKIN